MRQTNTRKTLCVIFSITLAVGLCPAPARGTIETQPAADELPTAEVSDATPAPEPASAPDAAQASDSAQATDAPEATGTDEAQASSSDEKSTASADAASDLDVSTTLGALATTGSDAAPDPLENMTPQGIVGPTPDMPPQAEPEAASDLTTQSAEIVDGAPASISRTSATWASDAGGTQYQLTFVDRGLYDIVLTGASGNDLYHKGGTGGTTEGVTLIDANSTFYAVTGGMGERGQAGGTDSQGLGGAGGANGGGSGGNAGNYGGSKSDGGPGGGGATHLAATDGPLSKVLAGGSAAIMVAGGGGGGGSIGSGAGGRGGGPAGENGVLNREGEGNLQAMGGTQSSGNAPGEGGRGGNGINNKGVGAEGRGGGGGGYWGGQGGQRGETRGHNASGAGGSGFLNESFFPGGTKDSAGGSITDPDGITIATTRLDGGTGDGTASVSYLASIVTLDSHAPQEGTAVLYSAPQVDRYYTAYSMDGLEDEATKIELPQMDGWKFMGYYTGDDGEGTRYITADGTIEPGLYDLGSTTLHALWEPVVSFDANGVETTSFPAATSVQTGTPVTEPDKPTALNTTFKGWSTDKNTYQEYDFSRPVTEPITLYAFWTPHVEFLMHGHGNQVAPQFLQSGQAATQPTAPSETGYTFGGWFTDPAFAAGTEYDFSQPVTGDVVLHAKWSANVYTIEFVDDGMVAGTEGFVYNDVEKPLRTASDLGLSREGWTFAGWRSTGALQVDYTDGERVRNLSTETGTLEFNAVWTRDVTFHQASAADLLRTLSPAADGEDVAVSQLTDGATYSSITAPLLASVGGWTPVGWSADPAATSVSDVTPGAAFTPMSTEFFGLYRRNVTLMFDGAGAESGSVEDMVEAQHMNASGELTSATFKLPANAFEYEGHTFRTWDLGEPGEVVTLKPQASRSPVTVVHAVWDETPAAQGGGTDPQNPAAPKQSATRRTRTPATGDAGPAPAAAIAALALLGIGGGIARRRRSDR